MWSINDSRSFSPIHQLAPGTPSLQLRISDRKRPLLSLPPPLNQVGKNQIKVLGETPPGEELGPGTEKIAAWRHRPNVNYSAGDFEERVDV